jgi:hypothetical protein
MPAPPQRFLTGNLQEFVAGERLQVHLVLNRWAEQLGPVFRFCILGRWKVVVTVRLRAARAPRRCTCRL